MTLFPDSRYKKTAVSLFGAIVVQLSFISLGLCSQNYSASTAEELSSALRAAAESGSTASIDLSEGLYSVRDNSGSPFLYRTRHPKSLTIRGLGPEKTILSGEGINRVLAFVWPAEATDVCPQNTPVIELIDISIVDGRCTPENCELFDTAENSTIQCGLGQNMYVTGGSGGGAGIYAAGFELKLSNVHVINNHSDDGFGGGAIALQAKIEDSLFEGNRAISGGGIYVESYFFADNLTAKNNHAQRSSTIFTFAGTGYVHGGAVHCRGAAPIFTGVAGGCYLHIKNSDFQENSAPRFGGAIYLQQGAGTLIDQTTFFSNRSGYGGALNLRTSSIEISGSTFSSNIAHWPYIPQECELEHRRYCWGDGGAISIDGYNFGNDGDIQIESSDFSDNISSGTGGAIDYKGGCFTRDASEQSCEFPFDGTQEIATEIAILNSRFSNNYSGARGGVLHATIGRLASGRYSLGEILINNSIMSGNTSELEGGVIFSQGKPVTMVNSQVTDNSNTQGSGSIHSRGSVQVVNSILYEPANSLMVIDDFDDNLDSAGSGIWNAILKSGASHAVRFSQGPGLLITSSSSDQLIAETDKINVERLVISSPLAVQGEQDRDFRLYAGSELIDAGSVEAPLLPLTDSNGLDRVFGDSVDIGRFEYGASPYGQIFGDSFDNR